MRVEIIDKQDKRNPLNGTKVTSSTKLSELLDGLASRDPFFLELIGDNGYKLLVGVGKLMGCVQYSPSNGAPPYLMAVESPATESEGDVDFWISSELTPVPKRFCLPFDRVKEIAAHFLETGDRSPKLSWEEI